MSLVKRVGIHKPQHIALGFVDKRVLKSLDTGRRHGIKDFNGRSAFVAVGVQNSARQTSVGKRVREREASKGRKCLLFKHFSLCDTS